MALSFQALSLNNGIFLQHALTGNSCKEADAYVISSLLDGVDPSSDMLLHAASPLPTSAQQKGVAPLINENIGLPPSPTPSRLNYGTNK
eukprot:6754482-Ditylum_brightwellii.AAC.1